MTSESELGTRAAGLLRVAVVGGGTMGTGIAHVMALRGRSALLIEADAALARKALSSIAANMDRQVKKGTITAPDKERALARIRALHELKAAQDADIVIEAVPEKAEIKKALFSELDLICPRETILATNTSAISIASIAAATKRPDRVVGMHFMNPVPVMELVELIRGLETSDETLARVRGLVLDLGKTPVESKDFPGFISNRILMPMINEACFALMESVASAEDIDSVMKLGMNHPMGPLELADLIGLDVCLNILEVLLGGFGDPKYRPCPLLRQMVAAGRLGRKSGRGFYDYGNRA